VVACVCVRVHASARSWEPRACDRARVYPWCLSHIQHNLHDNMHACVPVCSYAWNASLESVPSSIGSLAGSLTRVDLMDNRIAGSLPASLASLSSVTTAYFDDNAGLRCPLDPAVAGWLKGVQYAADPCAPAVPPV
jgi:hypothetical protein